MTNHLFLKGRGDSRYMWQGFTSDTQSACLQDGSSADGLVHVSQVKDREGRGPRAGARVPFGKFQVGCGSKWSRRG